MKRNLRFLFLTLVFVIPVILAACSDSSGLPDDYNYDDLSQYIKVGEYKGIEYTKANTNVSDAEVQSEIDAALEDSAESTEVKSGTVAEDSVVNIDYIGSIDGVEFEGGSAEDVELDIANSGYIEGFAEGIVGHEVGETFDLHVTFPEDYGKEELNGKPAVFKTTINYLIEKKIPEYNDEWVSENTTYNTVDEYEKSIREELESQKKADAESSARSEVFSTLYDSSEVIEYPEKEYQSRHDMLMQSYKSVAQNAGMELDEYISSNLGMDTETFNETIDSATENIVKTELILHSIAKSENMELTEDEYNDYLTEMLESYGYTEESFKEEQGVSFSEYASQNNMFMNYLYDKVVDKIMEYSTAK